MVVTIRKKEREETKKCSSIECIVVVVAIVAFVRVLQAFVKTQTNASISPEKKTFKIATMTVNETNWWKGQGQNQNATRTHLGARVKTNETSVFQMIVDP